MWCETVSLACFYSQIQIRVLITYFDYKVFLIMTRPLVME